MARTARPGLGGLVVRILFSTALVLVTWNPSGRSYVDWLIGHGADERAYVALAGVTLLILWIIYLRATFFAIGWFGVILAGAFLGALLWVMTDLGLLAIDSADAAVWAALVCIGIVLGIGMGWSHVRARLSGQISTDDVET